MENLSPSDRLPATGMPDRSQGRESIGRDAPVTGIVAATSPRIISVLNGGEHAMRLQDTLSGLQALGIDPAPGRNAFVRYYPPLDELPVVQESMRIDVSEARGSLALFLYIPFCTGSCGYCLYPKLINVSEGVVDDYMETLRKEIALWSSTVPSPIRSIYVGGGTPTYLSVAQIERLLGGLEIPKAVSASMTCECSPETLTAEKIAALKRCGVTRISMGVQSLDDTVLRVAGRRYNANDARKSIRLLGEGIESYNLDFIYGLEEQGREDVENILRFVAEVQPPSVTLYQRWSAMRDRFAQVTQEIPVGPLQNMLSMRARITEVMTSNGYVQDSLFRYVKRQSDGCSYCRVVWADQSCVAAGISAYGYLDGQAYQNVCNVAQYRATVERGYSPVLRAKKLVPEEQATRALVLGLKTAGANCALSLTAIERRYDVTCTSETVELLMALTGLGVMEMHAGTVHFTDFGVAFAEQILGILVERLRFVRRKDVD